MRRSFLPVLVGVFGLGAASTAAAHHSYAMFDGTRTLKVTGTVAKIEWTNPHVYVWVYVRNDARESGYDLYSFENGAPNALARRGWSRTMFGADEAVTIEYWPLSDGRTGGHLTSVTRGDGTVISGVGGPGAADGAAESAAPAGRTP